MNNKQLIKVVKALVEVEVAKKHEKFLTEQFPAILAEAVKGTEKSSNKTTTNVVSEEVDPFKMAEQVLQTERSEEPKRVLSKNPALNEVLNNTKPFSAEQRKGTPTTKSVLDNFQKESVNENIDKTVTFDQQGAGAGLGGLRANMAAQMGYGDMPGAGGAKQGGLGVQTGLPGLDRILNRDNSALVKKFKK
jgi:hypothetical protein